MMDSASDGAPSTAEDLLDTAMTAIVEHVEGVSDVYAPRNPVTQLPQIVDAVLASDPSRVNRVQTILTDAGADITTRIGVERTAATPEVARDVADALLAAAPVDTEVTVSVQVSRIG